MASSEAGGSEREIHPLEQRIEQHYPDDWDVREIHDLLIEASLDGVISRESSDWLRMTAKDVASTPSSYDTFKSRLRNAIESGNEGTGSDREPVDG